MPEQFYTPKKVQPQKQLVRGKMVDVIVVEGEEYDICKEHSQNRWSNKKTGEWGRGLNNTKEDPAKVERVGLFGEMAFAKILGLSVDITYRENGDKGADFMICDQKLNIKTAMRDYGKLLVKVNQLTSDLYVEGLLIEEDSVNKKATVAITGYCTRQALVDKPTVPAMKGNHQNKEMPRNELLSIEALMHESVLV